MPKFLVRADYTPEGTKGLLKEGASGRRKAVEELLSSIGGKLEAFYFTFGESDAVLIIDVPTGDAALSIAMTVRASGMIQSTMTPLMPVEEVDRAIVQHVHFRPPGT